MRRIGDRGLNEKCRKTGTRFIIQAAIELRMRRESPSVYSVFSFEILHARVLNRSTRRGPIGVIFKRVIGHAYQNSKFKTPLPFATFASFCKKLFVLPSVVRSHHTPVVNAQGSPMKRGGGAFQGRFFRFDDRSVVAPYPIPSTLAFCLPRGFC